ncbi:MAG TPA: ATP synthase F1 subunit delta [Tepidisphaeraceae bacterium]|jgi:F-type H+-transporting ATPase subunit delta
MSRQTHKSPTAQSYAQALLDLANQQNAAESTQQELAGIAQVLKDNPTFRMYLADPGIGAVERREAMDRIFRNNISPLIFNFLGVVNDHNRLRILEPMIDAYDDLLETQLGKIEVDVYVAKRLPPEQLEQVRQRVSSALKKDAVVHQYVDETIIGGLILRVGDRLIDASARYQLQALKQKLLEVPVTEA